ncbi:hypothetical protein VTN77DRAFT_6129 [Rasamsonia byssochlamydoides]|uniref:uncharacterized protein n=1 Tax=Rasamsonia byssochlamydoides TaxID=89139 RepID=UPI0037420180
MTINLLRILSSTIYAVLNIILFCLTLLTPGDFIYQCYKNHRPTNIFIVTGAYIITVALALFFYASRIYTNRTVLSGIPKAWIPVETGDVGKSVRRLVVEGLARSAIIAYQARPRDLSDEANEPRHDKTLSVDRDRPPWGVISHAGWSSPGSPDLPDLQYQSVILELPHLIEAKAVSLAPPDPLYSASNRLLDPFAPRPPSAEQQSIPDPRVVEILQRPATMGLREYIGHLTALNLINPPELGQDFLAIYERARFSSHPLHEDEFRTLMGIFAEILRGMKAVDPQLLQEIRGDSSHTDSESFIGPSDEEGETDTVDTTEEVGEPLARGRSNNSSTWESIRTAPMVQNNSTPSLSRTTERRALGVRQTPSMNSLQRVRSNLSRSSSGGSVIRLAEARSPLDLPYTIDLPGKRNR